jgi:sugar lactone lactonase YvrE
MKAECVLDCKDELCERPIWPEEDHSLYWADIDARAICRWNPATGEKVTFDLPEMVTTLPERASGGWILATDKGVVLWDADTDLWQRIHEPEKDLPDNRMNDGKTDRQGRFWAGSMYNNWGPNGENREILLNRGNLYRFAPDGTYKKFESGISCSNTLVWSPDDTIFYFADSFANTIYAYDFDAATGDILNRRDFFDASTDPSLGVPDGSEIDAEGYIWNTRYGGGCVVRIAPDGSIDRKIELLCPRITSAIFGGDDLDVLYIVTAWNGADAAERAEFPLGGSIFAIDPGVRGIPQVPYSG